MFDRSYLQLTFKTKYDNILKIIDAETVDDVFELFGYIIKLNKEYIFISDIIIKHYYIRGENRELSFKHEIKSLYNFYDMERNLDVDFIAKTMFCFMSGIGYHASVEELKNDIIDYFELYNKEESDDDENDENM